MSQSCMNGPRLMKAGCLNSNALRSSCVAVEISAGQEAYADLWSLGSRAGESVGSKA
jgi:hypothetical protein